MKEVTDQQRRDLSKALSYANWSALGLFIPFIGWLLAGMSLSFIKTIPVTTETSGRIKQIKRAARTSIIISSLAVAAWGGLYKYNLYKAGQEQTKIQQKQDEAQRQKDAAQLADQQRKSFQLTQLQSCLDNIDKWYNDNSHGLHQQVYWDNLLAQKKQYVSECQVRYPTN